MHPDRGPWQVRWAEFEDLRWPGAPGTRFGPGVARLGGDAARILAAFTPGASGRPGSPRPPGRSPPPNTPPARSPPVKIGVVQEIKTHEYRVALTPRRGGGAGARTATRSWCRGGAPGSAAISPRTPSIAAAGARLVNGRRDGVWAEAEMVMKVKEPLEPVEWERMRRGPDRSSPTSTWPPSAP